MTKRSESVAHKAVQYFKKHPDASVPAVKAMFGGNNNNMYKYRARARAQMADKETKVFFSKKTVDEALAQAPEIAPNGAPPAKERLDNYGLHWKGVPSKKATTTTYTNVWGQKEERANLTSTYPWANYGTFLSRDEYRGYLRGRVVDLMRDGLKENFDEAMCCAEKLTQLSNKVER